MSLQEWLSIATKGLAAEGRERVRREIEAHYEAAVEEASEQGLDTEVAQPTALRALGDCGKAQRRFNRVFLTEVEEAACKEMLRGNGFFQTEVGSWMMWSCLMIPAYTFPYNQMFLGQRWILPGLCGIALFVFWHVFSQSLSRFLNIPMALFAHAALSIPLTIALILCLLHGLQWASLISDRQAMVAQSDSVFLVPFILSPSVWVTFRMYRKVRGHAGGTATT
ncbi:MAG: hypothetical protein HUU16_15740 [Candidatus Omnitrophica bacterium]|nr:hypothetical protein [Candidatus Omnitrophota bacterium]